MRVLLRIFYESFVLAFHELSNNKLRAVLSLLGITIGIFCIITVLTAVDSLENNVRSSVNKLGDNVVYVQRWPWSFSDEEYAWWEYIKRPVSDYKEMRFLEEHSELAEACAIEFYIEQREISYQSYTATNVTIDAVSHGYEKIHDFEFDFGRFFTLLESHGGAPVCILGNDVAVSLFINPEIAIGKSVKSYNKKLKVIGVLKKEGDDLLGWNNDKSLIVPYNYAKTVIDVDGQFVDPLIVVEAKPGVTLDELKFELTGLLRASRKIPPAEKDNFSINQVSLLSEGLDAIFKVIKIGGWVIGFFSLLVGCFGIANIMFVSVRERTGLIGIKKALGAKSYFILSEFLIESIMLCLLGGFLGMSFTFLLILGVEQVVDFNFTLTLKNVIIGSSVSILIGIIAGIIPAFIASQMKPVDAMRY